MIRNCYSKRLDKLVNVDRPFILISQIQRSGGTLLSQLFDGHPECFSHPYEIKWGKPKKWDWPNYDVQKLGAKKLFKLIHEEWIDPFAKQGFYKKSPKNTHEKYPFVFDLRLQKTVFYKLAKDCPPLSMRSALDYYLTAFFTAWIDYQNLYIPEKKFVTGFIPRLVMHEKSLSQFFCDYPESFVISSIRHPAGWYSSATSHGYGKHGDIKNQLQYWIDSTRAILKARKQHGDRVIIVLFEDLVKKPGQIMREIARHTNIAWHRTLVQPTFNSIPIHSNSHFNSVDFVDPAVADNYKQVLDIETINFIEKHTADVYGEALKTAIHARTLVV